MSSMSFRPRGIEPLQAAEQAETRPEAAVSNAAVAQQVPAQAEESESPLLDEESQRCRDQLANAETVVFGLSMRIEAAGFAYASRSRLSRFFGKKYKHGLAVKELDKLQHKLARDQRLLDKGIGSYHSHMVLEANIADVAQSAEKLERLVERRFGAALRDVSFQMGQPAPVFEPELAPTESEARDEAPELEEVELSPTEAERDESPPPPTPEVQVVEPAREEKHDPLMLQRSSRGAEMIKSQIDAASRAPDADPAKDYAGAKDVLEGLKAKLEKRHRKLAEESEPADVAFAKARASIEGAMADVGAKLGPAYPAKLALIREGLLYGSEAMVERAFTGGSVGFEDIDVGRGIGSGGSDTVIFKTQLLGMGDMALKQSRSEEMDEELAKEVRMMEEMKGSQAVLPSYGTTRRGASGEDPGRLGLLMPLAKTDVERLYKQMNSALHPYDPSTHERRSHMSADERFETMSYVMRQTTTGLGEMHDKGLVHADVKGGNSFVRSDGKVEVADLGMGGVAGSGELSGRCGTSTHMAPEVAAGEKPTAASDLYSAGEDALIGMLGVNSVEIAKAAEEARGGGEFSVAPRDLFNEELTKPGRDDSWIEYVPKAVELILPDLSDARKQQFVDFIRSTMTRDPGERATADQLLKHSDFLKAADEETARDHIVSVLAKPTLKPPEAPKVVEQPEASESASAPAGESETRPPAPVETPRERVQRERGEQLDKVLRLLRRTKRDMAEEGSFNKPKRLAVLFGKAPNHKRGDEAFQTAIEGIQGMKGFLDMSARDLNMALKSHLDTAEEGLRKYKLDAWVDYLDEIRTRYGTLPSFTGA